MDFEDYLDDDFDFLAYVYDQDSDWPLDDWDEEEDEDDFVDWSDL